MKLQQRLNSIAVFFKYLKQIAILSNVEGLMLEPALFLLPAFLFGINIKLMLPNCYCAHLNHILFHGTGLKNFETKFTFSLT
jgi:hypothetical protein